MILVGAWVLIGELPRIIAAGDGTWWYGLLATFYYSVGTIPLQLGIALILATLLFQDVWGKAGFSHHLLPALYCAHRGHGSRLSHHLLQPSHGARQLGTYAPRRGSACLAE